MHRLLVPAILTAFLAACSTGPQTAVPDVICPAVGVVKETETVTRFRAPESFTQEDVVYTAHISDLAVACEEDDGIVTNIGFDIAARQGPAGNASQITLPYYVAVVRNGKEIVAKDVYEADLTFRGDNGRARVRETIRQHLAIEDAKQTLAYEILIGFQLSDDEFIYNLSQ